jgi:hypothetical protein
VRRKGLGIGRTTNTAPRERQEGGQEAPIALKGVLRRALYNNWLQVLLTGLTS